MATDDEAFRAFVDREYRPLVRGLALYCGDAAVAEELAQDAFARAFQRWSSVSGMARPDAWLRTVAFNLARSRFRRRAAERRAYTRHGTGPASAPEVEVGGVQGHREPAPHARPRGHRDRGGRLPCLTSPTCSARPPRTPTARHRSTRSCVADSAVSAPCVPPSSACRSPWSLSRRWPWRASARRPDSCRPRGTSAWSDHRPAGHLTLMVVRSSRPRTSALPPVSSRVLPRRVER